MSSATNGQQAFEIESYDPVSTRKLLTDHLKSRAEALNLPYTIGLGISLGECKGELSGDTVDCPYKGSDLVICCGKPQQH